MTETIVETMLARTITVVPQIRGAKHLTVRDTDQSKEVRAYLYKDDAEKLGLALIGDNATVITDLPEAEGKYGYVLASGYERSAATSAEEVLKNAKALLAIHKHLVEQQAVTAKEAEVAKAKEAELTKRRDELATEFRGYVSTYRGSTSAFSGAIDRIIELEEAAK